MSRNIHLCPRSGIHSYSLIPYLHQLKAHLHTLEALPSPTFYKPHTMGRLLPDFDLLDKHCEARVKRLVFQQNALEADSKEAAYLASKPKDAKEDADKVAPAWRDWKLKVQTGYEMLVATLWEVANEFSPAGFGANLTERLTTSWCDCGCSWDWLGEVCLIITKQNANVSAVD